MVKYGIPAMGLILSFALTACNLSKMVGGKAEPKDLTLLEIKTNNDTVNTAIDGAIQKFEDLHPGGKVTRHPSPAIWRKSRSAPLPETLRT